MKKILGIVGSLRASGNCEVMIKQICRELTEPHELRLLRLPEFRLNYCNGCYRCLMTERGCVIKDDLATVLDAICAADALILAVPTYFLAAHACLKTLIDRGISFYSRAESLWEKPAVGIGISGIEGKEGSTLLDVERFFATILAENRGCEIAYGALPGETVLKEENLAIARRLARALFAAPQPEPGLRCPLCGGRTFRFSGNNEIRCMLCSEQGLLEVGPDGLSIAMAPGAHPLLASSNDALNHRDWLKGMVGRFKAERKALAEVRAAFDDNVEWIRSPGEKRN